MKKLVVCEYELKNGSMIFVFETDCRHQYLVQDDIYEGVHTVGFHSLERAKEYAEFLFNKNN